MHCTLSAPVIFHRLIVVFIFCCTSFQITCHKVGATETSSASFAIGQADTIFVSNADGEYLVAAIHRGGIQSQNRSENPKRPQTMCQKEGVEGTKDNFDDIPKEEMEYDFIPDPFEPINRIFFHFNDLSLAVSPILSSLEIVKLKRKFPKVLVRIIF